MIAVVLVAVFAGCLVTCYAIHRMLVAHQEAMAAVIGWHARNLADEITRAEARISETARTGLIARGGPARLHDRA